MQAEDPRPTPRDTVLFDIEMALMKEEKTWPRRYKPGDHDRFKPLAKGILEHLELSGIRFYRKPPAPKHSTPDFQGAAGTGKESG